ncbi:MAG: AbrB/MazE/SpoVT family DNA-binding domain-containing protein [Phycisphaeraceae bacterium]
MKITTKGQVTIPQQIREKHRLWPNTEVEFVERNGRVILQKRGNGTARGRRVVAAMRGKAEVNMTTDQIMELTRGK